MMKCDKCGYDYGDSGDSAHACTFYQTLLQSHPVEKPSMDVVTIGRLKKKIAKLQRARDYHRKRHEHYSSVIALQPYLEDRFNRYENRMAEMAKNRANEMRVKEQEYLIRQLVGADPLKHYEIDALYKEVIKAEYKKLNEKK